MKLILLALVGVVGCSAPRQSILRQDIHAIRPQAEIITVVPFSDPEVFVMRICDGGQLYTLVREQLIEVIHIFGRCP